jgi:hypothetical protein
MPEQESSNNEATDYKSVKQQIEDAFNGTVYPGDNALIDSYGNDWDADRAYDLIRGRTWKEVASALTPMVHEELYDYLQIFIFLTARAYAYYLPALLLRTLVNDKQSYDIHVDLLWTMDGESDYFNDRMKCVANLLTTAQRSAALAYLNYGMKYFFEFDSDIIKFWEGLQDI